MTAMPDERDDLDAVSEQDTIGEPESRRELTVTGPDNLEAEASAPAEADLDLEIEELLSSEGIPASEAVRAPAPSPAYYNGESSLDELLDTFDDEELAAEAFTEAEAYGGADAAPPQGDLNSAKSAEDGGAAEEGAPQASWANMAPAAAPRPANDAPPSNAGLAAARARRAARRTATQSVRAAPQPAPEPTPQPAPSSALASGLEDRRRGGFWRGLGLVLLGGLLGVALTLLGLMIWSGTLSFASRAHVEALSRNLGTMQSNQELTWERVDALAPQIAEQESRVTQAEQALAESQQELANVRDQAAAAEARVDTLSQELGAMQRQLSVALSQADERMVALEGRTTQLGEGLTQLEEAVTPLQVAVQRFDDFLTSMRDLLLDLQGAP